MIRLAVLGILATASAFGQITASSLRASYGPPLDRETFKVRPNIEMVVDYGPAKQVCRVQLPSGMNIDGAAAADERVTKQQIDEVFAEIFPPSITGKELRRLVA